LPPDKRGEPRIVWGRAQVHTDECPKSLITGDSLALLDEYFVSRALNFDLTNESPARTVDAFLILREQTEREERNGSTD